MGLLIFWHLDYNMQLHKWLYFGHEMQELIKKATHGRFNPLSS